MTFTYKELGNQVAGGSGSNTDVNLHDGTGTPLTSTLSGGKRALDVNLAGAEAIAEVQVEISAASGDNIAISDGVDTLAVNADGSINVVTTIGSGTVTANQGTPAITANRWPVQITDGTDLALVTAAGESLVLATAQPGVDIGDVTVNNGAGGAAVNIQDGGNSITVDGTVAATQSGVWNITDITGTVSLPTGAATLAEQQTQTASLSVLDDWDETDRAKVNPIVGQAGVQGGAGASSASTQRVALATDANVVDTELPAAAALGDNESATPVVPRVGAIAMGMDSDGTIDRARLNTLFDLDTGGGTHNVAGVSLRVEASGGSIAQTYGAGAVAPGTQRVTHASDDPVTTAVQIMDDWDESDRAKVNPIVGQAGVAAGSGASSTTTQRVIAATDSPEVTALQIMDDWDNTASDGCSVSGDVAHDTADAGEPVKIGGTAVSGSASPTSVAAGDRTRAIFNQHGIPYGIGGHPNLITREYDFGTAAQTDVNLAAAAVAADERIYVTRFEALCDNANSVAVSVRAGFGTASVPTASATGVSGMIASHPGIAAGSGIMCGTGAGILAVGGAGEEPRITSSAATSGNLHVIISYFLIDETP